ncbi:hypothetical protein SUDANB105_00081 [Streptomyces sp. enrichment culture]
MEAAESPERLALPDRATARIGTTLDVKVTAGELVDAVVPDFADASVVEVVDWMDEPEVFDPRLPPVTHRIAARTVLPPRSRARVTPWAGSESACRVGVGGRSRTTCRSCRR